MIDLRVYQVDVIAAAEQESLRAFFDGWRAPNAGKG